MNGDKMLLVMDKITFGIWLKEEREKRGWSQSELARRCGGIDRQIISKTESGKSLPDAGTFIAIAKALNVSLEKVFSMAGLVPPISDEDENIKTFERLYRNLKDPSNKRRALKLLETLSQDEQESIETLNTKTQLR